MDNYKEDYEAVYGTKTPYFFTLENDSDFKETKTILGTEMEKNFHQINIGMIRVVVDTNSSILKMLNEILGCKIKTDIPFMVRTFRDYFWETQQNPYIFQISRIVGRVNTAKEFKVQPQTKLSFEIPPKMKFKIYIFPTSIEWKEKITSQAEIHGTNIILPKMGYKLNPEIQGWCCWQGLAILYYDRIKETDNEVRKKEIAKELIEERPDEFKTAVEWMNKITVLKNLWGEKK